MKNNAVQPRAGLQSMALEDRELLEKLKVDLVERHGAQVVDLRESLGA